MTAKDTVQTFDVILTLLKEVLPKSGGWTAQERVKVAVQLTKASALSVSGRD